MVTFNFKSPKTIGGEKCCRHVPKYKRAGGYVWEYKENYGD